MARAALFIEGEQIAERGLRVPKRVEKIEAWSRACLKTFKRELGDQPIMLVKHTIDADTIRLGYVNGIGILVRRHASPLG